MFLNTYLYIKFNLSKDINPPSVIPLVLLVGWEHLGSSSGNRLSLIRFLLDSPVLISLQAFHLKVVKNQDMAPEMSG